MICIANDWIEGPITCKPDTPVLISVVAYEHPRGIPARFCSGLIPAVTLVRQLASHAISATIRLIDPSPIANYCNGWSITKPQYRDLIEKFLYECRVDFFFDDAEQITRESLEILDSVGHKLVTTNDPEVVRLVERIKMSGMRHGGDVGMCNAIRYMSAHPFSWLDMYHPSVWCRKYIPHSHCFINVMSRPESRYTAIRKYIKGVTPCLDSGIVTSDHYMTICNTPCYVLLEGEPMAQDLIQKGHAWCLIRYQELKKVDENHRRALKDFIALLSFLEK